MEAQRPALVDYFGRVATDLRISVTDRCNFRCRYCMPPEGLPWLSHDSLLTIDELTRVAAILIGCGVRSIKITGGEPLVRRDVAVLVRRLRTLDADLDISLTTNGYLLGRRAGELSRAGLDRVTVSCDSLLRHRFELVTLRDAFDDVMDGLRAAEAAGLKPIKVNCVVMRGVNDDEVVSFAELARSSGYDIRFIEFMPLDAQDRWSMSDVVPGSEVLAAIDERYPLVPAGADDGPATAFAFADGAPGRVGVIPSVTEPFCATCDRLRLTADGQLRSCLFSVEETDLRRLLRTGAPDEAIAAAARACVAAKWSGHRIGTPDFRKPARSMSMIGG
ncbi:MAG: GTP 3',8-cyclase MoaA [Actinomycetota bacterium]|nr:GTP 3',8-cyclase MoaA [Actinomycetota bacterium]